ncbi:hypothetical protein [Aquimarina longa]|uniref:hypothetical protein n=1 Tax=Aquimarina longa TaxID=1080221 RepID=UPI000783ED7F|nr:hypothetical protein [Aquimarina longa]
MEYNEIKFKQFLKENSLMVKKLPQPLQEKINIFYRFHELIDTIHEPDLQELLELIEQLDIEILEDIEEEYEDQLTNNEPLVVPLAQKKGKSIKSDTMILEELVKMGRTKGISRSKLQEMGVKSKIGRSTVIGKYVLKKTSLFYYRYDIIPLH